LSTFLLIMLNLLTREPLIGSVRTSLGQRKEKSREGVTGPPLPPFIQAVRSNGAGFYGWSKNRNAGEFALEGSEESNSFTARSEP